MLSSSQYKFGIDVTNAYSVDGMNFTAPQDGWLYVQFVAAGDNGHLSGRLNGKEVFLFEPYWQLNPNMVGTDNLTTTQLIPMETGDIWTTVIVTDHVGDTVNPSQKNWNPKVYATFYPFSTH